MRLPAQWAHEPRGHGQLACRGNKSRCHVRRLLACAIVQMESGLIWERFGLVKMLRIPSRKIKNVMFSLDKRHVGSVEVVTVLWSGVWSAVSVCGLL